MLVWGGHDRVIPVVHAERAHRAMPGSRLEVFADAGHCPHLDEPSRFADVFRDFPPRGLRHPHRARAGDGAGGLTVRQATSAAAPANCELYRRA